MRQQDCGSCGRGFERCEKRPECQVTERMCIACDHLYLGEITCEECGEFGEPVAEEHGYGMKHERICDVAPAIPALAALYRRKA